MLWLSDALESSALGHKSSGGAQEHSALGGKSRSE